MRSKKNPVAEGTPTNRSDRTELHFVRVAAGLEALALGHTEVDVDHLVLGLLSAGGPSAQLFGAAGVDLHSARTAVVATGDQRLRSPGWSSAPAGVMTTAADMDRGLAVPLSDLAGQVMDESTHQPDGRSLLLTLLDTGRHRVLRLLEHLHVDIDALRAAATAHTPVATPSRCGHARSSGQRDRLPRGSGGRAGQTAQMVHPCAGT